MKTFLLCSSLALVACSTPPLDADVSTKNVLGSYIAFVTNQTEGSITADCTVTASTGDTDSFSVKIVAGDTISYEAKMPLSDFTDEMTIACT